MEAKQPGYVHLVLKFRMSGSVPSLLLYTYMHRDNFMFLTLAVTRLMLQCFCQQ